MTVAEAAETFMEAVGEDSLRAWACIDPVQVRREAARLDRIGQADRPRLPLFGMPIGVKDNFDTADLPTEYGSEIYRGHRPAEDAAAVARLRAAGALIVGKTACAEFAWMTPPDTLNPLDHERTPGGSSNGSAAAVAAGHVPLATGTQTAGSVNRPASYCGVFGFKPTFGRYDRAGVKLMSRTLDTVGLLAGSVADLRTADSALATSPTRSRVAASRRLAFAPTSFWDSVEPEAAAAIDAWVKQAGLPTIDLPGDTQIAEAQAVVQWAESQRSLGPELASAPEQLSDALRDALAAGAEIDAGQYEAALETIRTLGPRLVDRLHGFDAVLTPSATGVPPLGIEHTGDPLFSRVWTAVGAPSLSVPLVWQGPLPVGLQLVGALDQDLTVLATAERLLA
jgi:Asp-tRNA(Asn)/Glu-tRNA(Gln) amidotransferase A subunit family amidase